nr:immunoglobulin light chain junction region [Macaca mulatta]MPN86412.1 immunoglobulin light chain junction region [Macaca mulatta]
CLLDFIGARVF